MSEIFSSQGFRTGLVSDLYHQFKPSKNFWRGFHQWSFIRGQESDAARSGPMPSQAEIDYWVPREFQDLRGSGLQYSGKQYTGHWFSSSVLLNMHDRVREEQWFVPKHYRSRYDPHNGREQVISPYAEIPDLAQDLVRRTRANYAGLVEMCDRWFGHLIESLRVNGILDQTLVVVTADHGHSLWERRGYIGKRNYPSDPETYEVPLILRHPGKLGAGTKATQWCRPMTFQRRYSRPPDCKVRNRSTANRSTVRRFMAAHRFAIM